MAPKGLSFNYQTPKEEPPTLVGTGGQTERGTSTQSISGIGVVTKKMLTLCHWAGREGGDEWNYGRKEHGPFPDVIPRTCRFCDIFDQVKVM